MRSSSTFLILLSVGIVGLFLSAPVSAMRIVNLTQGTTLFYDDFEGLGSDVSHLAYPDASGDFDPTGGDPGSWLQIYESVKTFVQVTDYEIPGAVWGSNYLRLRSDGPTPCDVKQKINTTQATGDVVRGTQKVYIPEFSSESISERITLFDWEGNGWVNRVAVWAYPNGEVGYYDGSYNPIEGLTYTPDTWQDWELTLEIGATVASLTVNGVGEPGNVVAGAPGPIDFTFTSPGYDVMYIDAVPSVLIPGDANTDGVINDTDAAILAENWLTQGGATWHMGDFNGDDNVDDIDATMMVANWLGSSDANAAVPEPSSLLLLASGLLALLLFLKRETIQ